MFKFEISLTNICLERLTFVGLNCFDNQDIKRKQNMYRNV
jgi:hypothetical protein